ncbi:alpha/beta fold hydrolase [Sporichthya polymorpha]|uniref:alpha/beta fold hydrolase n=1 Tax=Sporichthya polymorpha TaxID=35751 RepID=UPI00039E9315|nr:alpha/beta fold hydrolase [Sporichthya polymorpha]
MTKLRRGTVSALAALTLVAAQPVVGGTAAAARPAELTWGRCADAALAESGAECTTVAVPADHAKPRGATTSIAISRIRATTTGSDHLGPLVYNPGGPGVSGLSGSVVLAALLTPAVAGRFDLIGFDPRGVGESGSDLRCDPNYFTRPALDYSPPDAERVTGSERERLEKARAYVRACAEHGGAALRHQRTVDIARDLDLIRAALGASTLSYHGNSWGTYLGQVYATLFPTRVTRMLLAGVVPPNGAGYAGDITRPEVLRSYQRNVDAFFAWVAEHHLVYGLGTDAAAVRTRWFADLDALRAQPRAGIGPAEWTQLFGAAVYSDDSWGVLAQAWSGWVAGRTALVEGAFGSEDREADDDFTASFLSIACSDGAWPRRYADLRADTVRNAVDAPFIAWALHWDLAVLCSLWPVRGETVPVGAATPSLLLVNATYDGPTPLADAVAARRAFPRSALIEVTDAVNHAGASLWGNPCAQAAAERYLLTGELPTRAPGAGPDLRCARLPEPGLPEVALGLIGEVLAEAGAQNRL